MKLTIVDVFAEQPLAGNQLAVVREAPVLTDQQMQAIAREMNFSETTFVINEGSGRAEVRIFTPSSELPFAGHPTLGTAWVLTGGTGHCELDLKAGTVPVTFEDGTGWMTPPPVSLNEAFSAAKAAELIGLVEADLDDGYPVRFAEVGPQFILIGVNSLSALKRARLSSELHERYQDEGLSVQCVFIFTEDSYGPDADYASRMYFRPDNVREDPATGSANSAFAAYLKDLRGGAFDVVVDQGVEMQRPSRLYLKVAEEIQVGGKVQLVSKGTFDEGIFD